MSNEGVDRFIRASDEAQDFSDAQLAGLKQRALEDIDALMTEDGERDPELWEELGVNPALIVADYEEDEDRGLDWMTGLSGLSAAATLQFFVDNRIETLIRPVAYREQVLDGFQFSREDWVRAGKRGSLGSTVEAPGGFKSIRSKYLTGLGELMDLDSVALLRTLQGYGALPSSERLIADAMGYVARMSSYPAGSPLFRQAVADLVDLNSQRGIAGLSRESVRRVFIEREMGGDESRLMVWIGEGARPCGSCSARFGEIKTYAQWIVDGMPGPGVCAGAFLCKCSLHAIN